MRNLVALLLMSLASCAQPADHPDVRTTDVGPNKADVGSADVQNATDAEPDTLTDGGTDVGPDAGPDAGGPDSFLALDPCELSIRDAFAVAKIDPPAADSGDYAVPDAAALLGFEQAVRAAIAGDFDRATTLATMVGYGICRGQGDDQGTAVFEPESRGTGDAVLALRIRDAAPAVLQAPHIIHDTNTLPQALALFEATQARALLVSGTHRCASLELGCSGRSTVCARPDEAYAASDMAHAEQSFYQSAHVALAESFPTDVVFSLHGMVRVGASVSDGVGDDVAPDSLIARVVSALIDEGIVGVTSCNAGTRAPVEKHLCGTTNTQGRHLNGSVDACAQAAASSAGRFVHLEQERSLRDDPERVAAALVSVLSTR